MSILCVNDASFYKKLHLEYVNILSKLIEYYKDETNHTQKANLVLNNFEPEVKTISDAQLNLQPIFTDIRDIETCKRLINLSLQFLSDNIPLNSLHFDEYQTHYNKLFTEVLYMLEYYSVDLKLASLKFFVDLISKYNESVIDDFHKRFPIICIEIIYNMEAIVHTIGILYENGEIDAIYLNKFNQLLMELLRLPIMSEKEYSDVVSNICCTVISLRNSKIFSKDAILQCLSYSKELKFPEPLLCLKSMDANEIEMVTEYYCKSIQEFQKESNPKNLDDNWCYNEVMTVVKSLKSCEDCNIDTFVIVYHLHRCLKVLYILQSVFLETSKKKQKANITINEKLLRKDDAMFLWRSLLQLIDINYSKVSENIQILSLVMDITLNTVMITDNLTAEETDLVLQILCVQCSPQFSVHNLDFEDDTKVLVLKYLMTVKLLLKVTNDAWTKIITFLIFTLSNNKTVDISRQVV